MKKKVLCENEQSKEFEMFLKGFNRTITCELTVSHRRSFYAVALIIAFVRHFYGQLFF